MHLDPCCDPTAPLGPDETACDPTDYTHYCEDVGVFTIALGIIMAVGSIISVLPQNIKFVVKKETKGVSLILYTMAMYNQWFTLESLFMAQYEKEMGTIQNFGKCWSQNLSLA